jgi:hypothetical protein
MKLAPDLSNSTAEDRSFGAREAYYTGLPKCAANSSVIAGANLAPVQCGQGKRIAYNRIMPPIGTCREPLGLRALHLSPPCQCPDTHVD